MNKNESGNAGQDRIARALAGGEAAIEQMADAVQWIELRGGPLGGKTAPEGQGNSPSELRLVHLPEPPGSGRPPEEPSTLQICIYRRQSGLRYVYRETLEEPIPSTEYAEIREAGPVFEKLRKLVTDQRLVAVASSHPGLDDPLPLDEAKKLRRRGIARFRRNANEEGRAHIALLSDDQVWEYMRGAISADLEWRDLGSIRHHGGVLLTAREIFALAIPGPSE
jgi:hypothetical protein